MEIAHEIIWIWLRKGNLKREIKRLITTAQNNVCETYYIKAKIDSTQRITCIGRVLIEKKQLMT